MRKFLCMERRGNRSSDLKDKTQIFKVSTSIQIKERKSDKCHAVHVNHPSKHKAIPETASKKFNIFFKKDPPLTPSHDLPHSLHPHIPHQPPRNVSQH